MAPDRSRTRRAAVARRMLLGCVVLIVSGVALTTSSGAQSTGPAAQPGQCPGQAPSLVSPSLWGQARSRLAPVGASAMRLCTYGGLNSKPRLTLVRSTLVHSSGLRASLVRGLNRLPPMPRLVNCPSDDGSQILALLAYPGGHHVTISVGLTGCQVVTNGRISRTAAGTSLVSRLERIARPG